MYTKYQRAIRWGGLLGAMVVFGAAAPQAQVVERLSDRSVRQIVDDVDRTRERFEDQLDDDLKSSILRAPTGEVRVDRYLDDLQENVSRIKDRMNSQYAASREVQTLLQQGSDIDAFVKTRPGFKGASEWDAMAGHLRRLAGAYQTTFPLPPNPTVRRISDNEIAATSDSLVKAVEEFKKAIDQDPTMTATAKDAMKRDADAIIKQARLVKERASDAQPSTAEMRELARLTGIVNASIQAQPALPAATTSAWNGVTGPLATLEQAYGLAPLP